MPRRIRNPRSPPDDTPAAADYAALDDFVSIIYLIN
jgi:hypothetical protein